MSAADILRELEALGIRPRVLGPDHVRLAGATDRLTPELTERARAHKHELLRLLTEPSQQREAGPTDAHDLDRDLSIREVLSFPAHLLPHLPLPPRLVLQVPGVDERVSIDTRRRPAAPAFDAKEWLAICTAAESQRIRSGEPAAWCNRKHTDSGWRLTEREAPGGAIHDLKPPRWTVGQVLDCLGATLVVVVVDGHGEAIPYPSTRARARAREEA